MYTLISLHGSAVAARDAGGYGAEGAGGYIAAMTVPGNNGRQTPQQQHQLTTT